MKKTKLFAGSIVFILAFSLVANVTRVAAETAIAKLEIEDVSSTNFPEVEILVSGTDVQGYPVTDLSEQDFQILEDGQTATISKVIPFTNNDQSLKIVLLLDTSGSMASGKPKPIENAVSAAKDFVNTLNPIDQAALLTFSDRLSEIQPLTDDKAALITALDSIKIGDQTKMYDAVIEGIDLLKSESGRKLIILITDGNDSSSTYKLKDAVDESVRWSIPIYTIGFGNQIDQNKLDQLTQLTGGVSVYRPDSTTISGAFGAVLDILRSQYKITFQSNLQADGKQHELRVLVNSAGSTAEDANVFTATPGKVEIMLPGFSEGMTAGGKIKLAPQVLSPAGLAKFEVLLDGLPLDSAIAEPFEVNWDSSTILPGLHMIKIIATDKAGNTGEFEINLNIQPTIDIEIISPQEGEKVTGDLSIQANVTGLSTISSVEFILDGKSIKSFTAEPYSYSFDSRDVYPGEQTLEVRAIDSNNISISKSISINVAYQSRLDLAGVIIIALVLSIAIIVPLSIRSRKRFVKSSAAKSNTENVVDRQVYLVEQSGLAPGRNWPLNVPQIRLGRKREENDIPLTGLKASRRHAIIIQSKQGWIIQSINADNPIIINGQKINEHLLRPGDVITAGDSQFKVEVH